MPMAAAPSSPPRRSSDLPRERGAASRSACRNAAASGHRSAWSGYSARWSGGARPGYTAAQSCGEAGGAAAYIRPVAAS